MNNKCVVCGRFVTGEHGRLITPDSAFTHKEFEYYCDGHKDDMYD